MRIFIRRAINAARKYTLIDYTFFKLALITFGILLGVYFSDFFLSHAAVVWVVFIFSYIFVMYRTFSKHMD